VENDTRAHSLTEMVALIALVIAGAWSWTTRTAKEPFPESAPGLELATLAGGCYWCMEPAFDHLEGVMHVRAGHAGERTKRREAVEILFDPARISYKELLDVYWKNVDPLDDQGQFCDTGSDYRSGIFVHTTTQRSIAEASKAAIESERGIHVVTEIIDDDSFSPAAEYDQNYYRKHPVRYSFYRMNCGRDARLHEVWSR